jgi:hypothetical protein
MDFRERERFVLLSGAAAVSFLMLNMLASLAGSPLGGGANKLATSLVFLYLCARLWGHATTLEERGEHAALARVGRVGAPVILLLLLAQIWASSSLHLSLSITDFMPHLRVSLFTRLEWSADVLVFVLFLATAIAVWVDRAGGASLLLSRIAFAILGFLAADLLAAVWGIVSVVPQLKLVASLVVLALGGTILVATVRRVERLDESEPA